MPNLEDEQYKMLAHPLRRALLKEMKDDSRSLAYLARQTKASQSRIANHLSLMERAEIITVRKETRRRVYALRKDSLTGVSAFVESLIK
jgi:DNA-binding transcriptional ArsR family regulator